MVKLSNRKLITYLAAFLIIVLISSVIPVVRPSLLDSLRFPFNIVSLLVREIHGAVFYHRNLIENTRLEKENEFLRQKILDLGEIYLENNRLKDSLAFKQKSPYALVAAQVIARDPGNWSSVILIDKGRRDKVKTGAVVITPLGLAGKIVEAGFISSKAVLINDPNMSVSAIIQRSRQDGLVSGTLQNKLKMHFLPYNADIKISDKIITSGLTPAYPKGILIGEVSEITSDYSGLTCLIKPAVDLSSLEVVFVIIQ